MQTASAGTEPGPGHGQTWVRPAGGSVPPGEGPAEERPGCVCASQETRDWMGFREDEQLEAQPHLARRPGPCAPHHAPGSSCAAAAGPGP